MRQNGVLLVLATLLALAASRPLLLAVEEPAGQVGVYDISGYPLGKVKVGSLPHEIVVTNDGRTAYVTNFGLHDYASPTGYAGYYVSVIDVKLMLERSKLFLFAAGEPFGLVNRAPHGMKLSPNQRTLWVNSEVYSADNTTIVPSLITFNLTSNSQTPSQIIRVPATMDKIHNFVFSPNGQDLWLQLGAQGIAKYNIANNTFSANFAAKSPNATAVGARGLFFAPNGNLLVSGVGEILEYSVASFPPTLVRRLWAADWVVNQFLYPTMTHDGRYILVPSTNGQIFIIDFATGNLVKRVEVFGLDPVMVVVDADDNYGYATAARGGAVTRIDLRSSWSRFGRTTEFPSGVNAGPNGLVIADLGNGRVRDERDTFKVVAVLSLSNPVAGSRFPNGSLGLPTGQPNGYKIKSVFEMWKENINQAGGVPFDNNCGAANVAVTYVDDFSNWNLTNGLLLAALQDDDVKALFVADVFFTPSAALLARLEATNVPLLSVYPIFSSSKRSAEGQFEEEVEQASLYKRQVPAAATVGYDRWVDSNNFNSEYLARFARAAAAVDGQAMTTALALQAALYQAGGELDAEDVLSQLTNLDTYFFYAGVKFSSTDGSNERTATGFPVLVNNRA